MGYTIRNNGKTVYLYIKAQNYGKDFKSYWLAYGALPYVDNLDN
jgi:hypothetical protein